jgi:hypothetical protein
MNAGPTDSGAKAINAAYKSTLLAGSWMVALADSVAGRCRAEAFDKAWWELGHHLGKMLAELQDGKLAHAGSLDASTDGYEKTLAEIVGRLSEVEGHLLKASQVSGKAREKLDMAVFHAAKAREVLLKMARLKPEALPEKGR